MYYFTDTTTTTDSRDIYFPLNLVSVCVRERGRGTRVKMERSGLSPSLSLLWQESASGNLRVSCYGDALEGGRSWVGWWAVERESDLFNRLHMARPL